MGEIQRFLHVQPSLSPTPNENDRLPNRHDSLRMLRIRRNSVTVRYVRTIPEQSAAYMLTGSCVRLR